MGDHPDRTEGGAGSAADDRRGRDQQRHPRTGMLLLRGFRSRLRRAARGPEPRPAQRLDRDDPAEDRADRGRHRPADGRNTDRGRQQPAGPGRGPAQRPDDRQQLPLPARRDDRRRHRRQRRPALHPDPRAAAAGLPEQPAAGRKPLDRPARMQGLRDGHRAEQVERRRHPRGLHGRWKVVGVHHHRGQHRPVGPGEGRVPGEPLREQPGKRRLADDQEPQRADRLAFHRARISPVLWLVALDLLRRPPDLALVHVPGRPRARSGRPTVPAQRRGKIRRDREDPRAHRWEHPPRRRQQLRLGVLG